MTGAHATGSLSPDAHSLPACRFLGRLRSWAKRCLLEVSSRVVRPRSFGNVTKSHEEAASAPSSQYLSALAIAENIEHNLKSMNREIAELENRLQRLAEF